MKLSVEISIDEIEELMDIIGQNRLEQAKDNGVYQPEDSLINNYSATDLLKKLQEMKHMEDSIKNSKDKK